jgi:hypothetical protein
MGVFQATPPMIVNITTWVTPIDNTTPYQYLCPIFFMPYTSFTKDDTVVRAPQNPSCTANKTAQSRTVTVDIANSTAHKADPVMFARRVPGVARVSKIHRQTRQTQRDTYRYRKTETQTETDRHRQTQTDTDRHRQTQTDSDRHRPTQ